MQNTATRIAVRMRDKRCLITGQAAVERARGGNFTGREVAHIYPLMGVGVVSSDLRAGIYSSHFHIQPQWTQLLSASAEAQVISRQVADQPHNAILLRADIHSLFDDYQWSIWVSQLGPTFCSLLIAVV
jgi:HNH endonuclease